MNDQYFEQTENYRLLDFFLYYLFVQYALDILHKDFFIVLKYAQKNPSSLGNVPVLLVFPTISFIFAVSCVIILLPEKNCDRKADKYYNKGDKRNEQ